MLTLLYILTGLAFLFVIWTLIMGAVAMRGKTDEAREKSNIWMRRRVIGQAVAIGLLLLMLYVKTKGG